MYILYVLLNNVLKMNASQKSAMLSFLLFFWNAPHEVHNYLYNLNSFFAGILFVGVNSKYIV